MRVVGLIVLLALASAATRVSCNLLWGHSPTIECLLHGELAKEGHGVDKLARSYSAGYEDIGGGAKRAMLLVRDPSGGLLSRSKYSANAFNAIYAGIKVENNGPAVYTVGTQQTGNFFNPANLLITRWLPGSGTAWTNPVNSNSKIYTPTQLGLVGIEAWGCRVIRASATDLFVSGCTDVELFVVRIDRATLSLVTTWGVNGVRSVASITPGGCPKHGMPGGFVDFGGFYPTSFIEITGTSLYLGGTLMNDLGGVPIDYDFVVAGFDVNTSAPTPFGVRYSRVLGDDYMKALAVNPAGVYGVGTLDPFNVPQMLLIPWEHSGTTRPPFVILEPTPSKGNDVEVTIAGSNCEIYVGGYGGTSGATWHYTHTLTPFSTVTLPALWSGGASGPNPKTYGPLTAVTDEVYDIGLGRGAFAGYVFSAGGVFFAPGQYGQPLQCIAPTGVVLFSNNPTPLAPSDDRAVAVVYHTASGGTVYTHGTAFDPGPNTFLNCPNHWTARNSRYKP